MPHRPAVTPRTPLVMTVQSCIEAYGMFPAGSSVLVAVSGGPDSMALLAVLVHLRPVYNLTLAVAHVNHQLRGAEARRDATFVQQQAQRFHLPYYQEHVDVKAYQRASGLSPQHAAREVRYQALAALRQRLGAASIALGHTADDQAETLLMRFLRGTGPAGLAGMPAVRSPLVRPLLTSQRAAIVAYLQTERIPWIEDSSNAQRAYVRNRVRLDLLPLLQQYNPHIQQRLAALAEMLQADNSVLEQHTDAFVQRAVVHTRSQQVGIRWAIYREAPLALQRRLLRRLLDRLLAPPALASFQHIEALRQFILAAPGGKRLGLPGRLLAEWHHDVVLLRKCPQEALPMPAFSLPIPGELALPALGLRLTAQAMPCCPASVKTGPAQAYIALPLPHIPLTVRFPQPGDRFTPLGAPGKKKLQDFFVDRKIPRGERCVIPLILYKEEIAWVVGHRIADPFKVTPGGQGIVHLCCEARG